MFYEFKTKTTKPNAKGEDKEVSEQWLTDCEFFSEAEAKGLAMYKECDVVKIARSDVREIVNPQDVREDSTFFKATIVDIFLNEDGTEKELKYKVLVAADSLDKATKTVLGYMEQGLQDMRLDGVVKTKIIGIVA